MTTNVDLKNCYRKRTADGVRQQTVESMGLLHKRHVGFNMSDPLLNLKLFYDFVDPDDIVFG